MDLPRDFGDLLEASAVEAVEYMLVGGHSVAFHARPRATKHIDVLLRGTHGNLERAARALEVFGARASVVGDLRQLGESEIVYLGQPPLRVDLLRTIDGIATDEVFEHAVTAELDALSIRVIARDDLVTNKRAAGRPQNLLDVAIPERARGKR